MGKPPKLTPAQIALRAEIRRLKAGRYRPGEARVVQRTFPGRGKHKGVGLTNAELEVYLGMSHAQVVRIQTKPGKDVARGPHTVRAEGIILPRPVGKTMGIKAKVSGRPLMAAIARILGPDSDLLPQATDEALTGPMERYAAPGVVGDLLSWWTTHDRQAMEDALESGASMAEALGIAAIPVGKDDDDGKFIIATTHSYHRASEGVGPLAEEVATHILTPSKGSDLLYVLHEVAFVSRRPPR